MRIHYLMIPLLLLSCSGLEKSEQKKIRKVNAKREAIYRLHDEVHFLISPPIQQSRKKYPWEENMIGDLPKITKDYFRCNGNILNPLKSIPQANGKRICTYDCGGTGRHSLPVHNKKERIAPILIDLLNEVQAKTGKKVIITCGHRCPTHNLYADHSPKNQSSKHLIGAEVDFYVEGLEDQPDKVIDILIHYFPGNMLRFKTKNRDTTTPPWYNEEVFIKLYKENEGRDFDNAHPYPYISIQVRYDEELKKRVQYSWQEAFNGYLRW